MKRGGEALGDITNLEMGRRDYNVGTKVPKLFELSRCNASKDSVDNSGDHLLKDCSCSFCLKAAYIWSDLHYQDIKSRITVVKKSQKEATFLVNKLDATKMADNEENSSKLQSGLTALWLALFRHTHDEFLHESTQFESSFGKLRDLRDDCKSYLESTTGKSPQEY